MNQYKYRVAIYIANWENHDSVIIAGVQLAIAAVYIAIRTIVRIITKLKYVATYLAS